MRTLRRLLWPVLAVTGVAAEAIGFGFGAPVKWVPDLVAGWALGGAGLVAWERREHSLVGPLMVATALLWFVGDVSSALVYAYRGPLVQLTVTYPSGRPHGRMQTGAVIAGYAAALVEPVWQNELATILLSAGLVAVVVAARQSVRGRARRERTYALRATGALAMVFTATAIVRRAEPTPAANHLSLLAFDAALALLALVLVRDLLHEPWARPSAGDLVVELADTRSGLLRDQLARALGDPTLDLAFPVGHNGAYVDAAGREVALPAAGSARHTTVIEHAGKPMALLIHDEALLDDPALAVALSDAARLAGTNARLQAEVRTQIAEVQASRRRVLAAADEERARLERRLEQTAERRLTTLLPELGATRDAAAAEPERAARLQRARDQLEQSLADLRQLAAGLHPRELVDGGLAHALRALAARSPLPVDLDLTLPDRIPEECERAAYFVCSEGLANVIKYASASRARVCVHAVDAHLRVGVSDDGIGGADPTLGSGLRGLTDRVEALGGALSVDSPPGAGTRLVAELPLTQVRGSAWE
jgi:signal transduction histidine kinase